MMNPNSLLLYKNRPARLLRSGDRLEIELENGDVLKVRPKDVALLHPGPLSSLADLRTLPEGEIQAAWEILAGSQTRLADLAELAYGAYTPRTAWAAWQQVVEGSYFEGSPDLIAVFSEQQVLQKRLEHEQASAGRRAWQEFIERVRQRQIVAEDKEFLRDTEALALGRGDRSQVLRALNRAETPDNAHALLLDLGVWDYRLNPYPVRQGVTLTQPDVPIPPLPAETRRDLTHLPAFAIDDEATDTPDDALSLDGNRLWVHVADVAALVPPDSPLDLEAQSRGTSLHLPEGTIHLLPRVLTAILGLGLSNTNPALSFGIDLSEEGEVLGYEIIPTWVRVTRLTYEQANTAMDNEPFRTLERRLAAVRERRRATGAVLIDFPENRIQVADGQVQIAPVLPLRSRMMVEEAMILASSETARFAAARSLAMPYSQQEPPETAERAQSLAGMFALRRLLKRSRYHSTPGPHSGLGVTAYTQVTSPLRRYLDLVGHQQLRAVIAGYEPLTETTVIERIAGVDTLLAGLRQAEILSEKHWTLVYLLQNPDWSGEGIVVDKRGATATVILPELAFETRIHLPKDVPLDGRVSLRVSGVSLAQRDVSFRVV